MFRAMTARDLAERPDAPAREERSALAARYRSLFVLGRGGMGSVEAALEIEPSRSGADTDDESAYQRVVALKRLLPDAARDKRRVDMFLREARLAAMLDHPNVVRAYDYGELDGELYLSMEYVEGQPLSRVLRALADARQTMDPATVAHVLAEVCHGLHAAHELADPSTGVPLRLVHRDVSPQNVMVGYDGRVRLLDFGVAKIETENLTKTGEVKGKTAYMSPEQAMGESLDRRSDLFGVGAILFECLALRRMWGDGTDMDVIRKLALESPPSLATCGVALPDGLAELHAHLVARDAKDRPATALEVAESLATFAGDVDTASARLCEVLETYFADQASEQRARLSSSLLAVAPERAESLRESVLPGSSTSRRSAPVVAAETTPRSESGNGRTKAIALGLAGLTVAIGLAWWLAVGNRSTSAAPTPAVHDTPTGAVIETVPTTPTSIATTIATESTPTVASAPPRPTTSSSHAPVTTSAKSRPLAPPATTASALPHATSAPKPPELDEKPF